MRDGLTPPDPASVTAVVERIRPLLDALDGVAYLVDAAGTLLACGEPGWTRVAERDAAPELGGGAVLGRSLFAHIEGDPVLQAYRRLHARCAQGGRRIGFEYRCDAPDTARTMRMSLTCMPSPAGPLVLYHSIVISEAGRPEMSLFDAGRRFRRSDEPAITICTWCHAVRWTGPPLRDPEPEAWIAPAAFYRRGGSESAPVSHGICPPCYDRVLVDSDGA